MNTLETMTNLHAKTKVAENHLKV